MLFMVLLFVFLFFLVFFLVVSSFIGLAFLVAGGGVLIFGVGLGWFKMGVVMCFNVVCFLFMFEINKIVGCVFGVVVCRVVFLFNYVRASLYFCVIFFKFAASMWACVLFLVRDKKFLVNVVSVVIVLGCLFFFFLWLMMGFLIVLSFLSLFTYIFLVLFSLFSYN